jgi:hypothetical protein
VGTIPAYGSNGVVGYHNQAMTGGPTIIIGRKGSIGEVHFSAVARWPIDTTYYIDRPRLDADLVWLSYWLRALNLHELNKAAAVPGLNREDAYAFEIPLQPLSEQKRIAAILNEQMASVERARAAAEDQLDLMTRPPYRCAVGVRAETLGSVGYPRARRPDKRRPCNHWCVVQPVAETGAGQACGEAWWLRSGWATPPLRRGQRSVLTGSGPRHCLTGRRSSPAHTPRSRPALRCAPSRRRPGHRP